MPKLHSQEAEFKLLGLLLKKGDLVHNVLGFLNIKDFYSSENKKVFEAIVNSFEKHKSTDVTYIIDFLDNHHEKDREDWMHYLGDLLKDSGIAENIEIYIDKIKDTSEKRNLKSVVEDASVLIENKSSTSQELFEEIEGKMFEVTRSREAKDFQKIENLTEEWFVKKEKSKVNIDSYGIKTKVESLDRIIRSFKPGDFVILAARPGVGKTAMALNLARNISEKFSVGFFSLEMNNDELIQRLLTSIAMMPIEKIENFDSLTDKEKISLDISRLTLNKLNLFINDSAGLKINKLLWSARSLKAKNNIDILFIDYIQLINQEGKSNKTRAEIVSDISRNLKQLARELKIPVIGLAQLNRETEKTSRSRPQLSDIRESGSLEQDADMVLFLYKNDQNEGFEIQNRLDEEELKLFVAKNRNGRTGEISLLFNKKFQRVLEKGNK